MRTQLHQIVSEMAGRRGDAPALTFKDQTVTYAELWQDASVFASGLAALGLERGQRVGICLDKRVETVVSIIGASAGGGVFVPINPLLKGQQVAYILDDCDVRVLITTADRLDLIQEDVKDCASLEHIVVLGGDRDGALSWADFLGSEPIADPNAIDTDMAAIFYTSGSTGKPKGVVLSHRNLLMGGESVSSYLENNEDDVILAVLPLSFDAGFSQLTTAFTVGSHVVLVNYLLPGDVVRLCAKHQVTGLTCVPPLFLQLSRPEVAR